MGGGAGGKDGSGKKGRWGGFREGDVHIYPTPSAQRWPRKDTFGTSMLVKMRRKSGVVQVGIWVVPRLDICLGLTTSSSPFWGCPCHVYLKYGFALNVLIAS